ncbi:unnamed protein product [Phytophthora fragariaefolia]|uniref:Unnamed protein product n=1 Tax=Phytophthora fragariaefolia TaxID=1490495 RepID=A0A9W6XE04_9STRA|nr:unnamed protein product [Phytophthora fragariaefolia]
MHRQPLRSIELGGVEGQLLRVGASGPPANSAAQYAQANAPPVKLPAPRRTTLASIASRALKTWSLADRRCATA